MAIIKMEMSEYESLKDSLKEIKELKARNSEIITDNLKLGRELAEQREKAPYRVEVLTSQTTTEHLYTQRPSADIIYKLRSILYGPPDMKISINQLVESLFERSTFTTEDAPVVKTVGFKEFEKDYRKKYMDKLTQKDKDVVKEFEICMKELNLAKRELADARSSVESLIEDKEKWETKFHNMFDAIQKNSYKIERFVRNTNWFNFGGRKEELIRLLPRVEKEGIVYKERV